jgi:hypothetical protein
MGETLPEINQAWFELQDVRRRSFAKGAWVPVYGTRKFLSEEHFPEIGYVRDTLSVSAVAIHAEKRELAEPLSWSDFSNENSRPFVDEEGRFHDAAAFLGRTNEDIGFRLVLRQETNRAHPTRVMIHQDFVTAYGLVEEENKWLRPCVGYDEVIRLERNERGVITFVEIRMEYLRDFLAARKAVLRLYYYRERRAIVADDPGYQWPEDNYLSRDTHDACEVRYHAINEHGEPPGTNWAVFRAWRTDVDPEEEIPDFTNQNESTEGESHEGTASDKGLRYDILGALWRGEWIEPADKVAYWGYGEPEEDLFVYIDAGGVKVNLETLNYESVGKYLWFQPEVVNALLAKRGSSLGWYSAQTGRVSPSPDSKVHFGVNSIGYINVYAYDIARLPIWERRIWVAYSARPDGGVSAELTTSQMECKPVGTSAPEVLIKEAMEYFDEAFKERFNSDVINQAVDVTDLYRQIHRFRAIDETHLRALAKDIVKYTIERLNKKALISALNLQKSELGTLKLVQTVLAGSTDDTFAAKHMAPLFGVYDLRGSDAHLGAGDIAHDLARIGVDRSKSLNAQAAQMIRSVADTIGIAAIQLRRAGANLDQ